MLRVKSCCDPLATSKEFLALFETAVEMMP